MIAFLSKSLTEKDRVVVPRIVMKLNESGFIFNPQYVYSEMGINNSHLFIGVMLIRGKTHNAVLNDWQYARQIQIPNFLLIEDSIKITADIENTGTVIRFDRANPQQAVEHVKNKIDYYKQTAINGTSPNNTNQSEIWGWVLGGAAILGIVAILSASFSKSK